jgi:hypothetical protein
MMFKMFGRKVRESGNKELITNWNDCQELVKDRVNDPQRITLLLSENVIESYSQLYTLS